MDMFQRYPQDVSCTFFYLWGKQTENTSCKQADTQAWTVESIQVMKTICWKYIKCILIYKDNATF